MPHPLDGCQMKLQRADKHLDELQGAVGAFLSRNPYELLTEHNDETGYWNFRVKVRDAPPLSLSAITGDVVHNLRSALDHLIWQLVSLGPCAPDQRAEFPIFKDEKHYLREAPKKMGGAPSAARTTIDRLQPYHRGDAAESHPLWMLHELDIIDKHRALHVTTTVLVGSSLSIPDVPSWEIKDVALVPLTEVDPVEGAVIGHLKMIPTMLEMPLEVYPTVLFDIQFGNGSGTARGKRLRPTLKIIRDFVHNEVLPELVGFF